MRLMRHGGAVARGHLRDSAPAVEGNGIITVRPATSRRRPRTHPQRHRGLHRRKRGLPMIYETKRRLARKGNNRLAIFLLPPLPFLPTFGPFIFGNTSATSEHAAATAPRGKLFVASEPTTAGAAATDTASATVGTSAELICQSESSPSQVVVLRSSWDHAQPAARSLCRSFNISRLSAMGEERSWMYKERKDKFFSPTWKSGLDQFLDHAFSLPEAVTEGKSKCPCTKCDCRYKHKRDDMKKTQNMILMTFKGFFVLYSSSFLFSILVLIGRLYQINVNERLQKENGALQEVQRVLQALVAKGGMNYAALAQETATNLDDNDVDARDLEDEDDYYNDDEEYDDEGDGEYDNKSGGYSDDGDNYKNYDGEDYSRYDNFDNDYDGW